MKNYFKDWNQSNVHAPAEVYRIKLYYIPITDTTFELSVFWPSDTESRINKLRFSESISPSFKTRLTSVTCFCSNIKLIASMEPETKNMLTWRQETKHYGERSRNFSRLNFKIRKNVRKKAYNKHIIINSNLIWRTVSRLVDEAIPLDHPQRYASRVIRWYDLIHSTWYSTPDQVTIMIMCIDQRFLWLFIKKVLVISMLEGKYHFEHYHWLELCRKVMWKDKWSNRLLSKFPRKTRCCKNESSSLFTYHLSSADNLCIQFGPWSGLQVIKLFSCSTQLSKKFIMIINVKMPTSVGNFNIY